jgi:hypothetical protein
MSRFLTCLLLSVLLLSSSLALSATISPQADDKAWLKWTKKEAEKILTDSGWSQVQTESDTSEMFFSPTSDPNRSRPTTNDESRLQQGAVYQSVNVKYVVRFFSARLS